MANEEPPASYYQRFAGAFDRLVWTPSWVKWDPEVNHDLSWGMNILFGLVSKSITIQLMIKPNSRSIDMINHTYAYADFYLGRIFQCSESLL